MSPRDPELTEFLDVLGRLVQRDSDSEPQPQLLDEDPLEGRLREAGALDLASETLDMDDALRWLAEVVACAAHNDPSIGFSLAARYVAQRALVRPAGAEALERAVTAALAEPTQGREVTVTVAHRFAPARVLVIATDAEETTWAPLGPAERAQSPRRTGLSGALLRDSTLTCGHPTTGHPARAARTEWGLLVSAACVGTAEGALSAASAYAAERRQFGSRLVDFAGLRAVLGEMALRVTQARALLDAALEAAMGEGGSDYQAPGDALVATSGRTAVAVALDAIQVHGGYGYIEEYPVAAMLRDAISLRARSFARRDAVAALAGSGAGVSS